MPEYPAGTVTFLFTDIEQSTSLWERDSRAARVIVERYLAIVGQTVAASGGVHFKTIGDGTQSAFATAARGIAGALAAQRALREERWPSDDVRPRVRMALHAGAAEPQNGDYFAPCLNRLARLMEAAHGEQILLSQTVAGLAGDDLPAEVTLENLGEFRLRDILQVEDVFQLRHPALRAEFPPLNALGEIPHNLPNHPTPFLGREREVEEIVNLLLRPEVRLVTLTGTGGVGKTRLALRVAAEALESFPDGAFVVDLAAQSDPALVATATATALGLREQPGQTAPDSLASYLRERQALLLFDNFEHLLPAATLVADLIAAAPRLKVLATSRARLGLQGEYEYGVDTLPVPDLAALPPLAELERYDAVALFVARARALRPDFALTAQNAAAVAAICARVDGLPLAIELAAARVKMLPPAALLERLEHRLGTLVGGARDLPARQRTVRDTIVWSHDLLSPDEATLFRRLSVFAGGWTLTGAEAVGAIDGAAIADPLTTLAALVDQNLVDERASNPADDPRFAMLETIREFAGERLIESGEAERTECAFETFLLQLVEIAREGLEGAEQERWLDRFESEHDNARVALSRALERADGSVALRLASQLTMFWANRGHLAEGRSWLERSLAVGSSQDAVLIADGRQALGRICIDIGDFREAATQLKACVDLRRRLADQLGLADALRLLAVVKLNQRRYDEAQGLGEEALAISRNHGDTPGAARTLHDLGLVAREQGDYEQARRLFKESLAMWRTIGDPWWIAAVVSGLGVTASLAANTTEARLRFEEARRLYERLGDRYGLAVVALESGNLAREAGAVERAIVLYGEALRAFAAIGAAEAVVYALEYLAETAAEHHDATLALRLFGAAEAARTTLRLAPLGERDARLLDAGRAKAAGAGGKDAESQLAAGRTLTLDQARDEALRFADVATESAPCLATMGDSAANESRCGSSARG